MTEEGGLQRRTSRSGASSSDSFPDRGATPPHSRNPKPAAAPEQAGEAVPAGRVHQRSYPRSAIALQIGMLTWKQYLSVSGAGFWSLLRVSCNSGSQDK